MTSVIRRVLSRLQPFRVCMWHTGRCGSSVVADLISTDGRIFWAGEVLERSSRQWMKVKLDHRIAAIRCRRKIEHRMHEAGRSPFGFEMELWHHHRLGLTAEDMHRIVTEFGVERHIVLERKNYLRQHICGRVAEKSGRYRRRAGEKAAITVTIDPGGFMHFSELCETYYRELRDLLPDHLYLTYEDDIASDPTVAYAKVMQHVGMESRSVATDRRETNARPLAAMVENLEELTELLSGTRYEWMLESSSS